MRLRLTPYLFLLPFFTMFAAFKLWPILFGIEISLSRIQIIGVAQEFVGLRNYARIFSDPNFYQSLLVTATYTIVFGAGHILLALTLALMVDRRVRGRVFFRSTYFLPVITSLLISAIIWRLILDKDIGLANLLLRELGLGPVEWLSHPRMALYSVMIVGTWRWFGFQLVILLAGLQGIDRELYDAATMDGANLYRAIRHITLPLLFPVLFFSITITLIGSLQLFAEPYILTFGGPADATLTTALYIYRMGFQNAQLGYAAALGYVLTAIIVVITVLQLKFLATRAGFDAI